MNSWPQRCPKLAVVMMVRNESSRIAKTTFPSIVNYIGEWFVYDTGSDDNTVEVFQNYCKDNNIILHLKQGKFVDFEVSRNVLLDYCDEILSNSEPKYLLLLDAHDELQDPQNLINFVNNYSGTCTGFYLTQRWKTSTKLDSYFNIRLVKSNCNWRYRFPVHEYIITPILEKSVEKNDKNRHIFESTLVHKTSGIILFQDRTQDDSKSLMRFTRDKKILYEKHLREPHEPRTLFYLAQTCACLGMIKEAYQYYLLRIKEVGFWEEVYHAYYRLGEHAQQLKHNWDESFQWYMKAFQYGQRVEPLLRIAEYYRFHNFKDEESPDWSTCYMFANMACQLSWNENSILFIDRRAYTYERWHFMGIIAYYAGKFREGKEACLKAIAAENLDIDKNNLKIYIEQEADLLEGKTFDKKATLAITLGKNEIRHKDESEYNYNTDTVIEQIISDMISERKKENKPLTDYTITQLKSWNSSLSIPTTLSREALARQNQSVDNQPVLPSQNVSSDDRRNCVKERLRKKLQARKK